jgi:hypothetical protein
MAGKAQAKRGGRGGGATKRGTERLKAEAQESGVETPAGELIPRGAVTASNTATGQALGEHERERPEEEGNPDAEDHGASEAVAAYEDTGTEPQGKQAEPARFAVNGTVEHGMVPSNYGPIPAAAAGRDRDHAMELADQNLKTVRNEITSGRRRLSSSQIARSSKQELRAIAISLGYEDVPQDRGSRVTREAFERAQAADESLGDAEEEE